MTGSGNNGVNSGELSITNGTVNYGVVAAVSGTAVRNLVLGYGSAVGVTVSGNNHGSGGELVVTNGAVYYGVVAAVNGTGSGNVVLYNCGSVGMTVSGNILGVGVLVVVLTGEGLHACVNAGGIGGDHAVIIAMSLGIDRDRLGVCIVATALTGVGHKALCRAGGSGGNGALIPYVLSNSLYCACRKDVAVFVNSLNLEVVDDVSRIVICDVELALDVVVNKRSRDMLALVVYTVLISAVYCRPGHLDLTALTVGSGNSNGDLFLYCRGLCFLSAGDDTGSKGERKDERKHCNKRENLTEFHLSFLLRSNT